MPCTKTLPTITVKKDTVHIIDTVMHTNFIALPWEFGVTYQVDEYVSISDLVYKSILLNTGDADNKPGDGSTRATSWIEIDESLVSLQCGSYYASERQDITDYELTFIVRLESTLEDLDNTTALFVKTATNVDATQGVAQVVVLETDNSTIGTYVYERQAKDTNAGAGEQKVANIGYGTYIIQEDVDKA